MLYSLVQYVSIALNLGYNRDKLYKTLDYWSRDILKFGFLEQSLVIVSPPHIVDDFSKKRLLMLYFLTDQISLSDYL